jgi:hypothetical protein
LSRSLIASRRSTANATPRYANLSSTADHHARMISNLPECRLWRRGPDPTNQRIAAPTRADEVIGEGRAGTPQPPTLERSGRTTRVRQVLAQSQQADGPLSVRRCWGEFPLAYLAGRRHGNGFPELDEPGVFVGRHVLPTPGHDVVLGDLGFVH